MDFQVYLINLEGSDDRLRKATRSLVAEKLPFTRVPAFDGRTLRPEEFPDTDRAAAMAYMGRPLRGGEIGCYLSHLDCARRFLSSDALYALVLEDDMQLAVDAPSLLMQALDWLKAQGTSWDVINIGANRLKYTTPLATFPMSGESLTLLRAHYFPMTTTGIVWSREGAGRFVSEHQKIFAPVDHFLREWQCAEDRGLTVWPPLVTATGAESDIDNAQDKRNLDGRSAFYGWLKYKRLLRNKLRAMRHEKRWHTIQADDKGRSL